jgi:hypothetical protein
MKAQLRHHVAALMLLAPAAATFIATPAVAQRAVASPQVTGLAVNADNGLAPGSVLSVTVNGTPNGRARVHLGGTDITIGLRETVAGRYSGSYTVRRSDRIDPTRLLTARLTRSNVTTVQNFNYPPSFQALAMGGPPAAATAVRIDRFGVVPVGRIVPGRELRFRLEGVPGATASVDIPGVASDIEMEEVGPGRYEGTYTVRRRDDPDAFTSAVATLRIGNRVATARSAGLVREDVADRGRGDRDRADGRRDRAAPAIDELEPRNGAVVSDAGRTEVAAQFDDGDGSGVDPASVRVTLSGRDVTSDARIREDGFRYRADLAPGRHVAEVTARDHAGNLTTKSWTFDVGTSFSVGPFSVGPNR